MTTIQSDFQPILVIGATGRQGGAVARALLTADMPVRALVRDLHSEGARALEALGASLTLGDLNDRASLLAAATGVRAVFSIQVPDTADITSDSGKVQSRNLV